MNVLAWLMIVASSAKELYVLLWRAPIQQKVLHLPRWAWTLLIFFYTTVPYVQITTALLPLRIVSQRLYDKIEGVLYSLVIGSFGHLFSSCGHTVREAGDDISSLCGQETLFILNHVTSGDMFVLAHALQHYRGATSSSLIIMFHGMKWMGLGPIYKGHGNFFIYAGKETITALEKHLLQSYEQKNRKWVVLFPEGDLLWKAKDSSIRYAKKQGLPEPKNVLIPRTGAFFTVLETLNDRADAAESRKIKYIVDVTTGYPGTPPDLLNTFLGLLPPKEIHMLYRIFPIEQIPNEADGRKEWLYELWQEKDKNLDHFHKTGNFPNVQSAKTGSSFPQRERLLTCNTPYMIGVQFLFIFLTCAVFIFWGFLLSCLV